MANIKAIRAAVQEYLETNVFGFAELDAEDKGEVIGQLAMTAARSVAMGGILGAGAKLAKQVKALLKGSKAVDAAVKPLISANAARLANPVPVRMLDPNAIRFSQDSIRREFGAINSGTIDDLVNGLKNSGYRSTKD